MKKKLIVAVAIAAAGVFSLPFVVAQVKPRTAAMTFSDSGPEPLLDRVFVEIEKNRLDHALKETESLLAQYPNFRLAHLIYGDLILARHRPVSAMGEPSRASRDKLDDLRDEALVRLKGYRNRETVTQVVPRYLLQMPEDQKHAIVVDTQKSRLYVYANDEKTGKPRFVADYYITQGKLGADKWKEGDKKTPLGVYHVTSFIPENKLPDLYGAGAYPINYPNEWDKRQGRSGSGIWLHGTPSATYSRPPKASDGCVVLSNADFNALGKTVQIGQTPVIISRSVEWLSSDDWQNERTALNKAMEAWRTDWESRDTDRLMRHYAQKFSSKEQNFSQFSEQKRRVAASKEWIKIKLENTSMFRDPGKEDLVVVSFDQDYQSNNLNNHMKKRQYWTREDNQWKIIYEGAA